MRNIGMKKNRIIVVLLVLFAVFITASCTFAEDLLKIEDKEPVILGNFWFGQETEETLKTICEYGYQEANDSIMSQGYVHFETEKIK